MSKSKFCSQLQLPENMYAGIQQVTAAVLGLLQLTQKIQAESSAPGFSLFQFQLFQGFEGG